MTISESERRRPTFVEGEPIALADGQAWHFQKPTLSIETFPLIGPDGTVELGGRRVFGPGYLALLEEFQAADEPADQLKVAMRLAVDLLGRNYDLGPEDYARLLVYREGDDANREMWLAILGHASGTGRPKPSAVGSSRP